MNNFELNFIAIVVILVFIGSGLFMGYSMDDNKSKDPVTALLDGYLIVLPMILMIGFLAPLWAALYGVFTFIYSIISICFFQVDINEIIKSDVTGTGLAYFAITCVIVFWYWFRSKVLGYDEII